MTDTDPLIRRYNPITPNYRNCYPESESRKLDRVFENETQADKPMTDKLFDIPPTHRPRIEAWKEKYGVQTHEAPGCSPLWVAVAVERFCQRYSVEQDERTDIPTLMSHYCAVIDEGGWIGEGETELQAIEELCIEMGWRTPDQLSEAELRIQP